MKIGYSIEGSTDRAFLKGLRRRWCPHAELVEGRFRGRSGLSQRREVPKTCLELNSKGVNVIVFLRDANDEDWRQVLRDDRARCPPEYEHLAVFGVCDRNIECWLCADASWLAKRTGKNEETFKLEDPKSAFEKAVDFSSEDEIARLVEEAPIGNWLRNRSFEAFYDALWQKSRQLDCRIENLREKG